MCQNFVATRNRKLTSVFSSREFYFKIDLINLPSDIIPIIAKHLLIFDNKFRFNKIFRKKNDNNLLKNFLGLDGDIFRYVNNYNGFYNNIECKEIYVKP
jgi:hypothetical protein